MSQDADAGDDDLDLSALEAAVANLGLDDEEEAPPNRPAPGLDLTEAPRPPDAAGAGVSVFDAPDLPEGIEIPDFSGASMVGSAAQDPDPFDDDDAGSSSGALAPPPTDAGMQEDPDDGDGFSSATDALREMGADEPDAAEEMVSLPAPDPMPEPVDADVMIETYTAQGGRVRGPLKAVKGLFGR